MTQYSKRKQIWALWQKWLSLSWGWHFAFHQEKDNSTHIQYIGKPAPVMLNKHHSSSTRVFYSKVKSKQYRSGKWSFLLKCRLTTVSIDDGGGFFFNVFNPLWFHFKMTFAYVETIFFLASNQMVFNSTCLVLMMFQEQQNVCHVGWRIKGGTCYWTKLFIF